VGSEYGVADPDIFLSVLDPGLVPACGVAVDLEIIDRATGVYQDSYGNIHVSGYSEYPGRPSRGFYTVFFPDCRPIRADTYRDTSSMFRDVEAYGADGEDGSYGSVTYLVGWVSDGFPNGLRQLDYSYSYVDYSVDSYTPSTLSVGVVVQSGSISPFIPTLNSPVNEEILLMRVVTQLPIISEFGYLPILLIATAILVTYLRMSRPRVARG